MNGPVVRDNDIEDDQVIYDSENSDLDRKHGQITQFGGIRTNSRFETISEINVLVRLLPWIVPMPGACRVTKVPPEELSSPGRISEFEAARAINNFLYPGNYSRRTFITYNGLRHDNECIRSMLFRNLFQPWFNSGKLVTNIDLFPLVQLVHAADPAILRIPLGEDGKFSYKLDKICPENGIEIRAHDALGDSYATSDLAKLISQRAPWAWSLAKSNGNFLNVETSITASLNEVKPLWLFTHFGSPKFSPVVPICSDGMNKHFVLDLTATDYATSFDESGKEPMVSKDSPFNIIKTKMFPMIVGEDIVRRAGVRIDRAELEDRFARVRDNKAMLASAAAAFKAQSYENPADQTSEEKIYGGFPDSSTKKTMNEFVNARSWDDRLFKRFPNDQRIRDFAARIFLEAEAYGDVSLKDSFRENLQAVCASTLNRPFGDETCRWSTLSHALKEEPDAAWLEWAIGHYGTDARLTTALAALKGIDTQGPSLDDDVVADTQKQKPSQMSFGF
jgi:exodeoxyribonuclease-1